MARKRMQPGFEQSLTALQQIVEQLEKGDLPLEDALARFEQGVGLVRECQQALSEAEQKVQILIERGNELVLQDFAPDDESA